MNQYPPSSPRYASIKFMKLNYYDEQNSKNKKIKICGWIVTVLAIYTFVQLGFILELSYRGPKEEDMNPYERWIVSDEGYLVMLLIFIVTVGLLYCCNMK